MFNRLILFSFIWFLTLCGVSFGAEKNEYMAHPVNEYLNKKHTFFLRWDYRVYTNTDFFDFWSLDPESSISILPSGLGYERKLRKNIRGEITIGYSEMEEGFQNSLENNDSGSFEMTNIFFLLSLRKHWPLSDCWHLFGGIGCDINNVDGTIKYRTKTKSYNAEFSRTLFGGHFSIGMEYLIRKDTDYPIGLELQYSYTFLQTANVDQDLIDQINADTGSSYSSNSLDLGGHTTSLSLKVHF